MATAVEVWAEGRVFGRLVGRRSLVRTSTLKVAAPHLNRAVCQAAMGLRAAAQSPFPVLLTLLYLRGGRVRMWGRGPAARTWRRAGERPTSGSEMPADGRSLGRSPLFRPAGGSLGDRLGSDT